jgi:hypothetical protein
MTLIDLVNPTRFLALVNRVLPWLALAKLIGPISANNRARVLGPEIEKAVSR